MNGFISSQIESTTEYLDDRGIPQIVDTEEWTEPIPCRYEPNQYNNKGSYVGGVFTEMTFEITTTNMEFKGDIIRLYDDEMNLIHEGKAKSVLRYKKVQRTKIKL